MEEVGGASVGVGETGGFSRLSWPMLVETSRITHDMAGVGDSAGESEFGLGKSEGEQGGDEEGLQGGAR